MMYLCGLASGLGLSVLVGWIVWPVYVARLRLPEETWDDACKRELARLDRDALNAELAEIPDTVRSRDLNDRSVN
jgi:hypothetical protein